MADTSFLIDLREHSKTPDSREDSQETHAVDQASADLASGAQPKSAVYALALPRPTNDGIEGISLRSVLLFSMLASIVFDFRRATDDSSSFIVVMGLMNVALALMLIANLRVLSRRSVLAVLPYALFLVVALISGATRGHPIYGELSRAVPLVMFITSSLAVANYARNDRELSLLLRMIVFASIASAVWKLCFAFAYFRLDIASARYQILSGATTVLFAFAITSFFVKRRNYAWIAFSLSLGVVAFSVTRSYALVFAVSLLTALLCLPLSRAKRAMLGLASMASAMLATLLVLQLSAPEVVVRWIERTTNSSSSGVDLTAATRLAEAQFQVDRLSEDAIGLAFGFGLSAETKYTGHYAELVAMVLGRVAHEKAGSGYGHIFYVGLAYVGGIFGGGLVIWSFARRTLSTILAVRRKWSSITPLRRFSLAFGATGCAGFCAFGFLGGIWGDRSTSFYFGLMIGLTLVSYRPAAGRR